MNETSPFGRARWRDRETDLKLFECLLKYLPAKIAFHIPSWLSRFVSMSKVAACFLRGLKDIDEFKNLYNKHFSEPWELTITSKDKEQILSACVDLPAQHRPGGGDRPYLRRGRPAVRFLVRRPRLGSRYDELAHPLRISCYLGRRRAADL